MIGNIYRLSGGEWKLISEENSTIVSSAYAFMPNMKSVIVSTEAILEFIRKIPKAFIESRGEIDKTELSFTVGATNNIMEIVYLSDFHTRMASVYLFLQFNSWTKKIRLIAYGYENPDASFGNSLSSISRERIIEYLNMKFTDDCDWLKDIMKRRNLSSELEKKMETVNSIVGLYVTL